MMSAAKTYEDRDDDHTFDPVALYKLPPEQRLAMAKKFVAKEHQKIMLALTTPPSIVLMPSNKANSSSLTQTPTQVVAAANSSPSSLASSMIIFNRIYIGSVQFDLGEEDIREAFQVFGPIKGLTMMMDPVAKRHRGYGFIEFETPEAASLALSTMDNTIFGQRHIKCGRPNNFPGELPSSVPKPPLERLYVSNVHEMIGEPELQAVFAAFGPVKACRIAPDFETRRHRGYGYVEFERNEDASSALIALHKFDLAGKRLQVGRCVMGGPLMGGMALLDQIKPGITIPLDKDLPVGVIKAVEEIQAKLMSSTSAPSVIPVTTNSWIRISNLEDVATLQGSPMEAQELESDVVQECGKWGNVLQSRLWLGSSSLGVCVFVQYQEEKSAIECVKVMNGRWFGGRQLQACTWDTVKYDQGIYQ